MKFVKTPPFLRLLFQSICFKVKTESKEIYLTFDDGPSKEFTSWILRSLDSMSIKATFFCTGLNAKKYPLVIKEIIREGHQIGNHGYIHKNSFFMRKNNFLKNIQKAEDYLPKTKLYRPPYGKIAPWQIKWIKDKYNIILWDVLSYDFSKKISDQELYRNVIRNIENGSIIVFHDNKQSEKILQKSLMIILEKLKDQGFKFKLLDSNTKEI
tara:strand:+ start:899 stop:1531 length:633 start_codon:yes stop_codon:yes gene_type:complete